MSAERIFSLFLDYGAVINRDLDESGRVTNSFSPDYNGFPEYSGHIFRAENRETDYGYAVLSEFSLRDGPDYPELRSIKGMI
jgi:hypothetical protein